MSIFELLGERHDPGPAGHFEAPPPGRDGPRTSAPLVIAAVLVIGAWLTYLVLEANSTAGLLVGLGATVGYLVVSYLVRPVPDYTNIGLLGGLVNHPLRYSDNINRFLIFLLVVLSPGRVVATALVDLVAAIRGPSE